MTWPCAVIPLLVVIALIAYTVGGDDYHPTDNEIEHYGDIGDAGW